MSEILFWTISLNTANVMGFVYSIPQMVKTWKTKSTRDIDTTGQVLRMMCSILWIAYCIRFRLVDVGVSWGSRPCMSIIYLKGNITRRNISKRK